jgi:hypothetical protein
MSLRSKLDEPLGQPARLCQVLGGTAEEAAEKVVAPAKSGPQALKRGRMLNGLAARVELVPFPKPANWSFSATSEAVPFQKHYLPV